MRIGSNINEPELFVVPLKFEGFKYEDGKISFESISSTGL